MLPKEPERRVASKRSVVIAVVAAAFLLLTPPSYADNNLPDVIRPLDGIPSGEPDYKLLYSPDGAGPFTFGFATEEKPLGFTPFTVTSTPVPGVIKVAAPANAYFSFSQNTTETKVEPSSGVWKGQVWPARSEGAGILHPGPNPADLAKARFTAPEDATYTFSLSAVLKAEDPTGVGVSFWKGGDTQLELTRLLGINDGRRIWETFRKDNKAWTTVFELPLKKDETFDVAINNCKNYQKDGVLLGVKVWKVSPSKSLGEENINVIAIDVQSEDEGETLRGTMTYSKEGPIGFLGKLRSENGGDNYTVHNEFGGAWHPAGRWVIGCRDKQHVVALKVSSKDNGETLNGSMTYAGEGPIQIRSKRDPGVVYDVENEYAGGSHNDGAWVLGTRGDTRQYLESMDIVSKDEGTTFSGTITYEGEGPIGFRATQIANDGNGYKAEVEFGGSWHPGGDWIIGGRNQRVVKLSVKSTDGGKTLSGTVTHRGEGPIGFKARISDGHAYTVENQWARDSWKEGGVFVLGSRPAESKSTLAQTKQKVSVADVKASRQLAFKGTWGAPLNGASTLTLDVTKDDLDYTYGNQGFKFPYELKEDDHGNAVLTFSSDGNQFEYHWQGPGTLTGSFWPKGTTKSQTPLSTITMKRVK